MPSETKFLALHPSEPIQENTPVALLRRTARITSRTSWSEPKIIAPEMQIYIKIIINRQSLLLNIVEVFVKRTKFLNLLFSILFSLFFVFSTVDSFSKKRKNK